MHRQNCINSIDMFDHNLWQGRSIGSSHVQIRSSYCSNMLSNITWKNAINYAMCEVGDTNHGKNKWSITKPGVDSNE